MQKYLTLRKYYQPAHIFTIWEFTYRLLPLYLWSHVWGEKSKNYPPQPSEPSKSIDFILFDDDSDALCSAI